MRGLYGAALGGSYLVQVAVQGATHHTPRPPRTTTRAALSFYIGARYLTVYSTVKGTLRTQKALQLHEEMDLFFLGPTTGQRAVTRLFTSQRAARVHRSDEGALSKSRDTRVHVMSL